jgi:ATP-dependent DNA helicase RecQ
MEAYYQETGRAGRDGEPADAWMVYSLADLISMRRILEASSADEAFKHIQRRKLDSLLGYCETAECRRKVLLRYFGEDLLKDCGNCDTCIQPPDTWDGTMAAQKALSCVYRTGQRFGAGHLADVLTGSVTSRVENLGHDRIKTFGVGTDLSRQEWFSVYRQLLAAGLLTVGESAISGFRLTPQSRPVLKGEKTVLFRTDPVKERITRKKIKKPAKVAADLATDGQHRIFDRLRSLRLELATSLQLPPYMIFHDRTLKEMAVVQPKTLEELMTITGVGEKKAEQYGERFLAAIAEAGNDFSP